MTTSDVEPINCGYCQGTGIGYGDPDTSKCSYCKGRGYFVESNNDEQADRAYDEWRDKRREV